MNEVKTIEFPWKLFTVEAFLFSVTLGSGIATAFRLIEIFKIQKVEIPQISFLKFIFYFLLTTFLILFIIKFVKFKMGKGMIFKTFFILGVSLGGLIMLEPCLPEPLPLIFILILIFLWFQKPSILVQDFLIVLGIAGTGSLLGLSMNPLTVIALLIIFSIYDWISVYKTKHMVKMAKEMIEHRAILALVVPPNISGFRENLIEVQPGGKFLILGGGDIVFPLLFCASLVPQGILSPLIVAIFSLVGLFVGFYIFSHQKTRQPIPALPPIALFSIFGYFLTKFLK